jgi:hypothetical protein
MIPEPEQPEWWVCPECGVVVTHGLPPGSYVECVCQIKRREREQKRTKKRRKFE